MSTAVTAEAIEVVAAAVAASETATVATTDKSQQRKQPASSSPSKQQQQVPTINKRRSSPHDVDDSIASTTSSCGESFLLCSDAENEQEFCRNNNNNNHDDNTDNDDTDRIQWTTTKPGSSSLNNLTAKHHHHTGHHHEGTTATTTTTNFNKKKSNNNNNMMMMTGEEVKREESKGKKIKTRIIAGAFMFSIFAGSVYSGHLYVCATVALVEFLLFRELVRVRYSTFYKSTIENRIPLFRTTQWMWFCLAIFYTYGDFVTDIVQNNVDLHYLLRPPKTRIGVLPLQYFGSISFVLYSATFVLTIATLQRKHIKFQINQLCWTILVLCLTVGQLKYVMHNIFNGLIWYVLPCCLVFTNDIMAYVTGMTLGRKFIQRPFIKFSPNKTWEGFIGGGFFTMVVAWYLSRFLAQSTWMTCPTNEFTLAIGPYSRLASTGEPKLSCRLDPIFQPAQSILPASAIFESLLPRALVTHPWIPLNVVDVCSFPQQQQQQPASSSSSTTTTSSIAPLLSDLFPQHLGSSSNSIRHDQENIVLGKCLSSPLDDSYKTASSSSSSSSTTSFDYETQVHHHYELIVKDYYPIQFHALWLALFASLVAPFGGFFASAMKRAYGIKDFDGIIPGHGGIMDRMDCQFLMALCTWVHYNTFVKLATISVPKLTYMYSLLSEQEKLDFLQTIGATKASSNGVSSKQAAVVETLADYAFG